MLVANINEFVLAHSITLNTKPPGETPERWDKIKKSLQIYLQKLIDLGEDIKVELNETNPEWRVVQKHLDGLISIFMETTKAVLVQQMKVHKKTVYVHSLLLLVIDIRLRISFSWFLLHYYAHRGHRGFNLKL